MSAARILHCARFFYLDTSNGAAIANRALTECLARQGLASEVLCGALVDAAPGTDPQAAFAAFDATCETLGNDAHDAWTIGTAGIRLDAPPQVRATVQGVPITALRRPLRRNTPADRFEKAELLSLFDAAIARFRPDVLVTYGGGPLTLEILARARRSGIATVFTLHNFSYPLASHFANVDAILVPSQFSAEHHWRVLGRECVAIPYLVDTARVRTESIEPTYVTFVNPSFEKGVYPFVRIADELGRRRPEIPLLVVESRGEESTVVGCGIDLRDHGNVFLMSQTADPRDFWRVTRVCLMPSLWWESQGLVAVEAMMNGIPVIGSDRGAIPETRGAAGIVLPIPERLTPHTRELPTAEEVAPWVEAIIRLWDGAEFYREHQRRALLESCRWDSDVVEPRYVAVFEEMAARASR
jgi:glycosyltransferase involved in cell wall biosynthesis